MIFIKGNNDQGGLTTNVEPTPPTHILPRGHYTCIDINIEKYI